MRRAIDHKTPVLEMGYEYAPSFGRSRTPRRYPECPERECILDVGGEEWGRRKGVGAAEGRRRAHRIKNSDPMHRPTDKYTVDPQTGDVFDPEGQVVGNLNEG